MSPFRHFLSSPFLLAVWPWQRFSLSFRGAVFFFGGGGIISWVMDREGVKKKKRNEIARGVGIESIVVWTRDN